MSSSQGKGVLWATIATAVPAVFEERLRPLLTCQQGLYIPQATMRLVLHLFRILHTDCTLSSNCTVYLLIATCTDEPSPPHKQLRALLLLCCLLCCCKGVLATLPSALTDVRTPLHVGSSFDANSSRSTGQAGAFPLKYETPLHYHRSGPYLTSRSGSV